jgi:RNA polymerase sigma-70 factor (ECF subfamily)
VAAHSGRDETRDFREIFTTYAPFVWRTLRHLGIAESDIDDVCQDVFVAVHRKIGGFEGRSSLKTWIYGICLRVSSDHRRLAHVRRELPVAEVSQGTLAPTQVEDVERGEARRLLLRLLEALDEDKRAVFVLYEIEELSMKEVAEAVGCPLQTAYSRLHAARKLILEAGERGRLREKP